MAALKSFFYHIYIEVNVVFGEKFELGEEVFIFEFNRFIRTAD